MSPPGRPKGEYRSVQHEGTTIFHRDLGLALVRIARAAIGSRLGAGGDAVPGHAALDRPGATFVTLMQDDELRGCIGTLEPVRPLGIDVRENALAAAFRDPRFEPMRADEFEATAVEVSLLSASEPVVFVDEAHLMAQLRPGVDGVILEYGRHRATFLPQVWDALPSPGDFLAALKRKAGLPVDFRDAAMNVRRYAVIKWKESDFVEDRVER
ncbi:MAG: AmmeMemoRadiSam system protein A [Betaproteobacteria bacterium]